MLSDKCKPKQNCEAFKELQAKCEYLEKRIEKMKCCENCVHGEQIHEDCHSCDGRSNWELDE